MLKDKLMMFLVSMLCLAFPAVAAESKVDELFRRIEQFDVTGECDDIRKKLTHECIALIEHQLDLLDDAGKVLAWFRLAWLYDRMMTDPAGWIKYRRRKQSALENALAIDAAFLPALILRLKQWLFYPSNAGGNRGRGMRALADLENRYPDAPEIWLLKGEFCIFEQNIAGALACFRHALHLDSDNTAALDYLEEYELLAQACVIRSVQVVSDTALRPEIIDRAINEFIGRRFTLETREQLEESVLVLPAVLSLEIRPGTPDGNEIDLFISLKEDTLKVIGFFAEAGLYGNYQAVPELSGMPAFIYIDNSFLGQGGNLSLLFAGVYVSLDYIIPRPFGIGLDLGLHAEALPFGFDIIEYDHGRDLPGRFKGPFASVGFSIVLDSDAGTEVLLNQFLAWTDYSGGTSDFTPPQNHFTWRSGLFFSFTTWVPEIPSLFVSREGLCLSLRSELLYQWNPGEWGPQGDTYIHDFRPAYRGTYSLAYFINAGPVLNIGGRIAWMHGVNLYHELEWKIGQTVSLVEFPRLSGYYPDEFSTGNAALLNLDCLIELLPSRLALLVRHDLLFREEDKRFYNGSALGIAVRLKNQFEFSLAGRIAWSADRASGPGWGLALSGSWYLVK